MSAEEGTEYMSLLRLRADAGLIIVLIEIDGYVPLLRNDRYRLLRSKERLTRAAEELSGFGMETVCLDWIAGDRLSLMIQASCEGESALASSVEAMLDQLRQWSERELDFSVTIGIGSVVNGLSSLKDSFRTAREALQYKMTAGNNRVIVHQRIQKLDNGVPSHYFKWLEDLVLHFRAHSLKWKEDFSLIFDHLEEMVLKNEDMQLILNYFMHRFAREMEEISPEINEHWQENTYAQMCNALRDLETTGEIRDKYMGLIEELYDKYTIWLDPDNSKPVIYEVRRYIEENYANPDLSLKHISERFGINGKYASQLFKEAFDMKFVDFVIGLRIEQAQKQLRETNISVNEIARQVGYENPISFGRIFKKVAGMSPGDYRKMMQPGRAQSTSRTWESSPKSGF